MYRTAGLVAGYGDYNPDLCVMYVIGELKRVDLFKYTGESFGTASLWMCGKRTLLALLRLL